MEAIALLAFVFLLAWWFTRGKKEEVHTDTREVPTTADVITGSAGSSQPLGRTEFAFIDLETTGLDPYSDRIIEVARTGISILMVEQNARQALEIADIGYVLVQGANAYTDTGPALLAEPEVRRTFLGG